MAPIRGLKGGPLDDEAVFRETLHGQPSGEDLPVQPGPLQLSRPIREPPMNPVTSRWQDLREKEL